MSKVHIYCFRRIWSSNAVVKTRATTTDLLSGAIARAKPRRVVFLSSYASYNFGELYAEENIGPMAGVTFLRASYFINNWGAVLGAAKSEGVLPTFLQPERKIPMVWADDIGVTVAQLLMAPTAPAKNGRIHRGRRIQPRRRRSGAFVASRTNCKDNGVTERCCRPDVHRQWESRPTSLSCFGGSTRTSTATKCTGRICSRCAAVRRPSNTPSSEC
jgi:hypothetical protein